MENNKKSIFETLNSINVSGKTEKKNGLTYLSWAYAWGEVKKIYPNATYKVYERDTEYGPVNYFTDGMTCWVKVGVAIEGLEHVEMLPVMDYKNQAIPLAKVNACNVTKAVQRCITKAIARHGLGLYVYAGEDYPVDTTQAQPVKPASANKPIEKAVPAAQPAQAKPQAPVKDTRPVTDQMVGILKDTIKGRGMTEEFICDKYQVSKLEDLKVYQAKHIEKNLDKLKQMFVNEKRENLADIQPQEKTEGEEIDLQSLGLTEADLNILAEAGNIFS